MKKVSLDISFQKLLFGRLSEGQRIVVLLFTILVISLLILYFNIRVSKMIGKKEAGDQFLLGPAALAPQPESQPQVNEVKKIEEVLRDPFLPSGFITNVGYKDVLKLESILIDPYNPADSMVMINSQPLKLGDRILGAIVLKIESEKVVLKQVDKEIILRLWED